MIQESGVSIVFITRNRQRFFPLQIKHWSGSGASLLIVDGSDSPWSDVDQYDDNPFVTYVWSPTPPFERLRIAASEVKTKYLVMSQEEDFLLPTSVTRMVGILESSPDLVAVSGEEAPFRRYGKKIRLVPSNPTGMKFFVESDSAVDDDRLERHFSNFAPRHYYSVMRREAYAVTVSCLPTSRCSWSGFTEFAIELCTCLQGPTKVINVLTRLVRSIFDNEEYGIPHQTANTVVEWQSNPLYADERSIVIEEFAGLLLNAGIGDRPSVEIALHSMQNWFSGSRATELVKQTSLKMRVRQFVLDSLPDPIEDVLIQFRNVFLRGLHDNRIVQGAQLKQDREGTEFNQPELIRVSRLLI